MTCIDSNDRIGSAEELLQRETKDRRPAIEQLQQSEHFLWSVFDAIQDGISVLGRDLTIVQVNSHMEKMYAGEMPLIGKKCYAAYQRRDTVCANCPTIRAIESGVPTRETVRYRSGSKDLGWIELSSFPLKDGDNGVVGVIEHVRDVTERKRVDEALRASEERLRLLVENAPNYILSVDRDGKILFINRTITGGPVTEVIGKSVYDDYLFPEFHDTARKTIENVFRGGRTGSYEAQVEIAGRDFWFETHVGPIRQEGKILAAMLIGSDVTGRKKAEERLHLLSSAFRQNTQGIAISDLKGNIIEINQAFAAAHGYTSEELIGKNLSVFHTPAQMPAVAAANRKIQAAGEFTGEVWHVRRDGTVFPTRMHNCLLRDGKGKPVGMIGTIRDITERKRAEEALRESEARLRTAMESIPFDFFVIDESGRYVMENSHCKRRWGDIIGKRPEDLGADPETRERWQRNNHRAFAGEVVAGEAYMKFGDKEGFYHNIISPIYDDGKVRGILGVNIDITDRRRAEDLLRLQRDLGVALSATSNLKSALELLLEAALRIDGIDCGAVYLVDETTREVVLAAHRVTNAESIAGVSRFEPDAVGAQLVAAGKAVYRTREQFCETGKDVFASERLKSVGTIPVHHEGQVVASLNVGSRVLTDIPPSGRDALETIATQMGGVIGRMRAERARRRSEEHYRALIENASDLISILTEEGTFRYLSPSFKPVLGYESVELKGKSAFELIHPDDVDEIQEAFERGSRIPDHVEGVRFRFRHKDGSWRVLDATGTNLLHVPAVSGVVINARDITERRMAQEASLVFSRSIEQSRDAIIITGPDRCITFANQAAERLFGYSVQEMMGHRPLDIFGFDHGTVERAWAMLTTERRWSGLLDGKDREGNPITSEATVVLICDERDQPIASVSVLRDVRETRRLASIQRVAEVAAAAETGDDMAIRRIMAHLPELVGIDRWGIYLHKPGSDVLELVFSSKAGENIAKVFPTIPISGTVHGSVLRTGQIEYTPDLLTDDRFSRSPVFRRLRAAASSENMRALCMLPLRAGGRILGTLNVSDRRVRVFTPEELNVLKTLASQVGRLLGPLVPEPPREPRAEESLRTDPVSVVAESEAMKLVLRAAQRIAATNMPAIILGPTGAGKGHVAKYIHSISPRADGPFLGVNCACLDGELILSELFGHERGAFTGAVRQQKGCFEMANSGTLLLDEVVELPLSAQAKLLQLVETQQFRRLGGEQTITTDVRLVCTTNADIRESVRTSKIRQDLYYRLSAGEIVIPPLCERPEDIQPLAEAYLRTQAMLTDEAVRHLTAGAVGRLREYHWPGNVRELQNVLALAMSHGGHVIGATDLRFTPAIAEPVTPTREAIGMDEREQILQALRRNRWNRTLAAELLGIHRNTLRNRMRKYNIVE